MLSTYSIWFQASAWVWKLGMLESSLKYASQTMTQKLITEYFE